MYLPDAVPGERLRCGGVPKSSKLCRPLLTVPEVSGSVASNKTGHTSTGRHGAIQQMTISVTGCYRVKTAGAKGGDSFGRDQKHGGRGALIAGNLSIVVGQAGGKVHTDEYASGGGGGGSFVYRTLDNGLLMAAGGGGGASYQYDSEAGNNATGSVGTEDPNQMGIGGANGQPRSNDQSTAASERNPSLVAAEPVGLASPPPPAQASRTETEAVVAPTAGSEPAEAAAAAELGLAAVYAGGGGGSFCGGSGCVATTGGNTGSEHGFVLPATAGRRLLQVATLTDHFCSKKVTILCGKYRTLVTVIE
uniref:PE-PGRS family protein n=1 Tax=Macrostomum lignano TaxID=282301 RepID=A0A1I8JJU9_9PLAT